MAEIDHKKDRRDSESFQFPANLGDENKARVMSCMDEIRNITGETYSDKKLYDAIMANEFDINRALDEILNNETAAAQVSKKPKVVEVQKGWWKIHSKSSTLANFPSLSSLPPSPLFVR